MNFKRILPALALLGTLSLANTTARADCATTPAEQADWEFIKFKDVPRLYYSFLQKYPHGGCRSQAIFEFEALVPQGVTLDVSGRGTDRRDHTAGMGEWLYMGPVGRSPAIIQFTINAKAVKPEDIKVQYECETRDLPGQSSNWIDDGSGVPCHPRAPLSPLVGLSVRVLGSMADFYDVDLICNVDGVGGPLTLPPVKGGEWCGGHGNPGRYVTAMNISIKRHVFKP